MRGMIIGIAGRKGAGKDSAAAWLARERGFARLAFADPLRAAAAEMFGLTKEEMTDRALKERRLDRWPYESPREILQKLGTDACRSVWPDLWIERLKARARSLVRFQSVLVTDVRFPNEAHAIRQLGGRLVFIDAEGRLGPAKDAHISESYAPMLKTRADLVLENNDEEAAFLARALRGFDTLVRLHSDEGAPDEA